jgi:thiamine pyrophosphate-dependent acetolactate synthase large subunit-like protein
VDEVMLDRREAIKVLLRDRRDLLVVSGLGSTTYDVASVGDDDRNFYLWGAMGGACMVGLGIALARPDQRILAVTGDGEMLMGMGSLATIAMQRPPNLAIVVLDNGLYGETGMQPSHAGGPTNLARVANACGIPLTLEVSDEDGLARLAHLIQNAAETLFARVLVLPGDHPRVLPPRDGVTLKLRFRYALGLAG